MVGEFEFIENIKSRYGLDKIGDDCAVLPKDAETDLLLTADMLVEDIDFRLEWTTPEFLGHKALAVSLSDIAAMGGEPKWAMLSIGVPKYLWNTDFIDRFYAGWFELANKFGIELVGGDVSRSPDKLVIDSIVGGEVTKDGAILRSTAKPGDSIFIAGTLGGSAGGLKLLENGARHKQSEPDFSNLLILKQLKPQPQLEIANLLKRQFIASSMIDVSDGFSSDLAHLCRQSEVGAVVENIPVEKELYSRFLAEESLEMALHGGEDFGLLFTVPPNKISDAEKLSVNRIGRVISDVGKIEFVQGLNHTILEPKGYRHF